MDQGAEEDPRGRSDFPGPGGFREEGGEANRGARAPRARRCGGSGPRAPEGFERRRDGLRYALPGSSSARLLLGRQAACMTSCATLTTPSPGRTGRSQIRQTVSWLSNAPSLSAGPITAPRDVEPQRLPRRAHGVRMRGRGLPRLRRHATPFFGCDRIVPRPRARFHAA